MTKLTQHQVAAARAMLGLNREELAEHSGVSRGTIISIENGTAANTRAETFKLLIDFFTRKGIEFIGSRGVAFSLENYRVLEGADCYLQLLDEVYHDLRGKPDAEVLSICTDDSVSPQEVVTSIKRWHEAGIKCRFLSHENATRFDFPTEEYRLIASRYFKNSVMIVFGNKVATLRGTNDAVQIVTDEDQADMLRGLFELIWSQAEKPKIKPKK